MEIDICRAKVLSVYEIINFLVVQNKLFYYSKRKFGE